MFETTKEIPVQQVPRRGKAPPEPQPQPEEGISAWVESKLGFVPDAPQRRVLETGSERVLLNCTRQWGKSTVTAARAAWMRFSDMKKGLRGKK